MQIRVNPTLLWGAVFSVPAVVVDKYMKLASAEQIRTLLWVLRHAAEAPTTGQAAEALRYTEDNVREYVAFWQQNGILQTDAPTVPAPQTTQAQVHKPEKKPERPEKPALPDLPDNKPTAEDILKRIEESPDLAYLFQEAQKKFARTLGYDGQCTLLLMHDRYGLPVEVILMIIEYCAEVRKTSNAYIAAMGKSWAQEEIDTIEKAAEKIGELRRCGKLWKELASTAGLTAPNPTTVQSEYLRAWSTELGYGIDMIFLAYEEMANHCSKLSFAYMNKVLRNWHGKGLKTAQDVAEDNRRYREKKSQDDDRPPASYDIDEMEQKLLYGPIVYKKNDRRDAT
jgi:DnaD/phage-associated family protein